jgi:hypothetical protein
MRGLEDADVRVLDVGKRRTVPDVFRMLGHKHTIRLSSVVRKLYVLAGGSGKEALSPPLAEKILELHPGIHESVSIGKMVPSHVAPDTNFAVAYFLGAYIDKMPERALEYVNIVAKSWKPNGEFPESSSNGASKTRELLVTLKHECGGRMRIDPDLAMKHAVYGWQLYRDKKIVKALKVPSKLEIDNWDLNMCLGSNKGKRNARKSSVRA